MIEKQIPVMVNCIEKFCYAGQHKRMVQAYDNGQLNDYCCVHGNAFVKVCLRCDSYFEVQEKMQKQTARIVSNA